MDAGAILALVMFGVLVAALMAGFPVAFTLAGVALATAGAAELLKLGFDLPILMDIDYLRLLPDRIHGALTMNEVILAAPLFIAMGVTLERSKVAEDLLASMGQMFGSLRGGLGLSVTMVGALLAASTGIVGATVVTMGLLSLPTMLKHGYDKRLATGVIAAAGTLGQIIPPSIVLVLLGDVISTAHQEAQRALGNWSYQPVSVGHLFAGALLPGIGLVGLYLLYQIAIAAFRPKMSPALGEKGVAVEWRRLLRALMPPITLIIAVLGSILSGIATPTEAAAIGAVGATLLGGIRQGGRNAWLMAAAIAALGLLALFAAWDLVPPPGTAMTGAGMAAWLIAVAATLLAFAGIGQALWRLGRAGMLGEIVRSTALITTMVYMIFIGAALFSLVFRGLGGDDAVHHMLTDLPGGRVASLVAVMAIMFFLGFFLDFIEIVFVVVPIVAPVLLIQGYDPVWLAVMIAINLQTSFLTPPFGFALFYLRGVAPGTVSTGDIYRGAIPFVLLQIGALILLSSAPTVATWLPSLIFHR